MGRSLDTTAQLTRLLQRTGFDAPPEAVEAAGKAGFEATVDRILAARDKDPGAAATPVPDVAVLPPRGKKTSGGAASDKSDEAGKSDPDGKGDTDQDAAQRKFREAVRAQREQIVLWWLDRMVAVEQPWVEKRTLLWHNHWATSVQKVKSGRAMLTQNETLRRLGGGDFRTLARAMVRDPALMVWLDAPGSTAKAPNENLARELMELFVLGVGAYTENDVRQAAAVLTGWTVNRKDPDGWKARYQPRRHAAGPHEVVGEKADFTAQTLIDHLVDVKASPAHVALRFWQRLVDSSKEPSDAALKRLTEAYGPRRDVSALLRALLTDPAFRDPDSVLVKQPVEYVVGALRTFGLRPSHLPDKARKQLVRTLSGLGQVPFAPTNVGGWPAGAAWLTSAAAQVRIDFAQSIAHRADLSAVERVEAAKRPGELAARLGVGAWGPATEGALAAAAHDPRHATAIALTAPEYLVLA